MALLINVDGSARTFKYVGIDSAKQQLGGWFDRVPGNIRAGYLVLVHDEGLLLHMPRNPHVEAITGYPEVYGAAVFVSYEEARETELIPTIDRQQRRAFLTALKPFTDAAVQGSGPA